MPQCWHFIPSLATQSRHPWRRGVLRPTEPFSEQPHGRPAVLRATQRQQVVTEQRARVAAKSHQEMYVPLHQSQLSLFPVNSFSKHTTAPSPLIFPFTHQLCRSPLTCRGLRAGGWRSHRQLEAACLDSGLTRTATRPCSATSWPTPTAPSPMTTSLTCWSSARWVVPPDTV